MERVRFAPLVGVLLLVSLMAVCISTVHAQGETLTPRAPIFINGDGSFTPANGVNGGGSGTADDPYIIENWVIDASGAHGISIQNTTAYFIVRNCLVENGGGSYSGIYLNNVVNGKVENNTCENNSDHGIFLDHSSYNTISNNTCSNNSTGIGLEVSSNNILSNNTLSNNSYNFSVLGYEISHFDHDIDTSNLVNGKPIYYLKGSSNLVIDNSWDVGYLGLVNCENIRVENLVLENNGQGILLASTENSRIENCAFSNNNSTGIFLWYSSYNTISNNTCENNEYGILLDSSSSNTLNNNTCSNNSTGISLWYWSNTGIILWYSSNNTISNNTCENNETGIYLLRGSDNNTISNNTCENNRQGGIRLDGSSGNTLDNNTCSNNTYGIYLYNSFNNTIFYNYLLNNTEHNAYDYGTNFWDEDEEGNYWDDWQPPEHPDADGDGIVDEPRPILGGTNQDNYPLAFYFSPVAAPREKIMGMIVIIIVVILILTIIAALRYLIY